MSLREGTSSSWMTLSKWMKWLTHPNPSSPVVLRSSIHLVTGSVPGAWQDCLVLGHSISPFSGAYCTTSYTPRKELVEWPQNLQLFEDSVQIKYPNSLTCSIWMSLQPRCKSRAPQIDEELTPVKILHLDMMKRILSFPMYGTLQPSCSIFGTAESTAEEQDCTPPEQK